MARPSDDHASVRFPERNETPLLMTPTLATILASYNCTAACEHCCFDSHPGIKQRLSLDQIVGFIDKAASFPTMRMIVFSGGECFMLGADLVAAVRHTTSLGLASRCVTNGYWATTEDAALRQLKELKEAGLKEINFSTGDFHQKYVPQPLVINGVLAALRLQLQTVVVAEVQKARLVTAESILSDSRLAQLLSTDCGKLFKVIESPWMPMSLTETVAQDDGKCVNCTNVHTRTGCESILATIVVTPKNQFGICCGLSRELIPELNFDLTPERSVQQIYRDCATDFMKIWIAVEGPDKILAWAASKHPLIKWENRFCPSLSRVPDAFSRPARKRRNSKPLSGEGARNPAQTFPGGTGACNTPGNRPT